MKRSWADHELECELVFDRHIGDGSVLISLHDVLKSRAPGWWKGVHIWRSRSDQQSLGSKNGTGFRDALVSAATERGELFHELTRKYGPGPASRLTGSVEVRGDSPDLIVVVSVDEFVVSKLGQATHLGNTISLQIRRRVVAQKRAHEWLGETFEELIQRTSPVWASACHGGEYEEKVMSSGPQLWAEGRDFGRFLPSLFWINFFGPRYVKLIGEETLESAPAFSVQRLDSGFLIRLSSEPTTWSTKDYRNAEGRVLDHLGPQHFFSKRRKDVVSRAPDWSTLR